MHAHHSVDCCGSVLLHCKDPSGRKDAITQETSRTKEQQECRLLSLSVAFVQKQLTESTKLCSSLARIQLVGRMLAVACENKQNQRTAPKAENNMIFFGGEGVCFAKNSRFLILSWETTVTTQNSNFHVYFSAWEFCFAHTWKLCLLHMHPYICHGKTMKYEKTHIFKHAGGHVSGYYSSHLFCTSSQHTFMNANQRFSVLIIFTQETLVYIYSCRSCGCILPSFHHNIRGGSLAVPGVLSSRH